MSINISNLHAVLLQKISSSANEEDTLVYSKAIAQLNLGIVTSVFTFAELPTVPDTVGRLYFVESDRALYIYSVQYARWILLASDIIGLLFTWGRNNYGRLGDNTTLASKSSPVSVVGGFTNWCQVSAGDIHTAAIRTNGTLWTWGSNSSGQLGDNTAASSSKSSPVSVVGGFTNWCQVSAGVSHTAAVRTNGTLWTWGFNAAGQLGDNTAGVGASKSSPVSVVGGFTDWCQVSAGCAYTVALRTNCTLWTWGCNNQGQLGDNTIVSKSSPVSVVGGFTDWCQVSTVFRHTAALRTNGTLWAWGYNGSAQLGDNTIVAKSSPVSVVGGFTDWCQVSAGSFHTAAVRTNGTLWAWGTNILGTLGDNTVGNKSSPVSVVGGFTDWCQVSAGDFHSAAIRTNGTLWSWGRNNNYGQLGDNTIVNKSSPISVVGGFTDWCRVSAGTTFTAALRIKTF